MVKMISKDCLRCCNQPNLFRTIYDSKGEFLKRIFQENLSWFMFYQSEYRIHVWFTPLIKYNSIINPIQPGSYSLQQPTFHLHWIISHQVVNWITSEKKNVSDIISQHLHYISTHVYLDITEYSVHLLSLCSTRVHTLSHVYIISVCHYRSCDLFTLCMTFRVPGYQSVYPIGFRFDEPFLIV